MPHARTFVTLLLIVFWASPVWADVSVSATSQPKFPSLTERVLQITPSATDTPKASGQWAIDVAVGEAHTCALGSGAVYCWGDNTFGQLGDGTTQQRSAPVLVIGLPPGVTAIAAGPVYTCAAAPPFVWCWGAVMRHSQEETWLAPQVIPFEADVVALTAGTRRTTPWQAVGHVCTLTSDGDIYCWGSNDNGQLGNGTVGDTDQPQLVVGINRGATAVAAGNHHTCALVRGGVKCWGWNGTGQIGDGSDAHSRWAPVDVIGMEHDVVAIDVAGNFSCALTRQHKVWCWGEGSGSTPRQADNTNSYIAISAAPIGKLCGIRANRMSYCGYPVPLGTHPVPGFSEYGTGLETGFLHDCYLTDKGGVKCWGWNDKGQLGMGTTHYQATPVEPTALYTDVVGLATQTGTCVLRTDASVECFAPGGPVKISGLEEGAQAVNGQCAVTNNGGAKCWGESGNRAQSIPGFESGVMAIATSRSYSLFHTCALMDTGGVKCWGNAGGYGECGNGTTACTPTPTDVVGLTSGVQAIAVTSYVSCAVMASGNVKCWGDDVFNEPGADICVYGGRNGEYKDYCNLTPANVEDLPAQVREIALGGALCALATNGDVECRGGGLIIRNIGAKNITVGRAHQCILLESGSVQCWGNNDYGQVGNGVLGGQFATPVEVIGLEEAVVAISAGADYTCAVTESGGVRCWGRNDGGELGINTGQTPVDVLGFGVREVEHHHLPWLAGKED